MMLNPTTCAEEKHGRVFARPCMIKVGDCSTHLFSVNSALCVRSTRILFLINMGGFVGLVLACKIIKTDGGYDGTARIP